MISAVIPSRNRPLELSSSLGWMINEAALSEVIIVDNSDRPYTDNRIFVVFQDAFRIQGKRLIFLRERPGYSPAYYRWVGAQYATEEYLLCWDDDHILLQPMGDFESRFKGYGQMGFLTLDAVNYCGFADWTDKQVDPGDMTGVDHPSVLQYRFFKEDVGKSAFTTPWGTGGIFLVLRKQWVDVCSKWKEEMKEWPRTKIAEDVYFNVRFLAAVKQKAIVHFRDKTLHLRYLEQHREWSIGSVEEINERKSMIKKLKEDYIGKEAVNWL